MQRDNSFEEKQNMAIRRGMSVKDATRALQKNNGGLDMESIDMNLIDQDKLFDSQSEKSSRDGSQSGDGDSD